LLKTFKSQPVNDVTHMAKATMDVNRYSKHVTFYLTKLGYYPIILGMLLLKRHDP